MYCQTNDIKDRVNDIEVNHLIRFEIMEVTEQFGNPRSFKISSSSHLYFCWLLEFQTYRQAKKRKRPVLGHLTINLWRHELRMYKFHGHLLFKRSTWHTLWQTLSQFDLWPKFELPTDPKQPKSITLSLVLSLLVHYVVWWHFPLMLKWLLKTFTFKLFDLSPMTFDLLPLWLRMHKLTLLGTYKPGLI